jgi:hypothetical protein
MDLASIVKPGTFIVDDVALPPPITFLVLPGEKAVAAKLAGGRLGLASGGPRVGRLSETGSDNDDREGHSGDSALSLSLTKFDQFIADGTQRWAKVIRLAGIKLD